MYKNYPSIVFGFHACKRHDGKKLIAGSTDFKPSENQYDWLGHGMYFWENSLHRAKRFAEDRKIDNHCIIGAALQLGYCLDLTDSESLSYLSSAYSALKTTLEIAEKPLPKNKQGNGPISEDLLLRDLDCAVINFLHAQREDSGEKPFDSVRGVFWEGDDLYPGAGFKDRNHIQICIRNPNSIKGFFWPRQEDSEFDLV